MKKKNLISLISFLSVFVFANYTVYKTAASHPGSTGAPLDLTCAKAGCHADASVTLNAVNNNTLTFSSIDSSYVPGQTYSMTVKVNGPVSPVSTKFGFEIGAIKDADSLNVGSFVITNSARTQIITHPIGGDMRYSVTHKTASTPALSSNYNEWSFNWTAPPINEGKITFYYATNCTNNNGQNTGDKIFLHTFQIHPSSVTSVKQIADEYDLKLYYDAEAKEILVSYDLKGNREVQVNAFDNLGKLVYKSPSLKLSGAQKQKISIGTNFPKGAYLVQLSIGNQIASKKVIVY